MNPTKHAVFVASLSAK